MALAAYTARVGEGVWRFGNVSWNARGKLECLRIWKLPVTTRIVGPLRESTMGGVGGG